MEETEYKIKLRKVLDENSADTIEVKNTPNGFEPNVPMMDSYDSTFEVNEVLSNVVGEWLKSIWNQSEISKINLPVTIVADEGYGTILPIKLN